MRRTKGDRDRKVGAHAHGEKRQPVAASDLCRKRKMRGRSVIDRRDAHEARNRQPIIVAAGREKRISMLRLNACLLRLVTSIDLDEEQRSSLLLGDLLGQGLSKARPVKRMDSIKQRDRFSRLVRLQRADKMKLKMRMARGQRRPFGLSLLDPVLAEYALAFANDGLDRFGVERLRHGNECHALRVASGLAAGASNVRADGRKPDLSPYGFHFVNRSSNRVKL